MSEAPLQHAWSKVEASWDDDDAHRRFIELAATLGLLSEADLRYRRVRDGDPERAESAAKRIDELFAKATLSLKRLYHGAAKLVRAKRTIHLGVVLVLLLMILASAAVVTDLLQY